MLVGTALRTPTQHTTSKLTHLPVDAYPRIHRILRPTSRCLPRRWILLLRDHRQPPPNIITLDSGRCTRPLHHLSSREIGARTEGISGQLQATSWGPVETAVSPPARKDKAFKGLRTASTSISERQLRVPVPEESLQKQRKASGGDRAE